MTRTSALTHLNHPNIVPILDFGIEDGVAFIVMQYIPDGNLRQRHPRGARIELAAVINYVQQISPAIQYIHDLGFVHRDIKPHNLLVDKNASIMLSDFGATIVSHSLSPIHVSQREFEGTAPYAAPEQLQGKPCRNSDQYALGVMIYEWLSGDWPFNGSFYEITHQHLFVAPPAFKERGLDCPPNIEQVIFRALEKEPARRFPNVKRFVEELAWATKVAQAKGLSCGPIITATAAKIPPASQVRRQFKSPFTFEPK